MASDVSLTAAESDAAEQAGALLDRALTAIAQQNKAAGAADETRLFFPSGIELISLRFDVGTSIKISFTIAGKEAKYGQALVAAGAGRAGGATEELFSVTGGAAQG